MERDWRCEVFVRRKYRVINFCARIFEYEKKKKGRIVSESLLIPVYINDAFSITERNGCIIWKPFGAFKSFYIESFTVQSFLPIFVLIESFQSPVDVVRIFSFTLFENDVFKMWIIGLVWLEQLDGNAVPLTSALTAAVTHGEC